MPYAVFDVLRRATPIALKHQCAVPNVTMTCVSCWPEALSFFIIYIPDSSAPLGTGFNPAKYGLHCFFSSYNICSGQDTCTCRQLLCASMNGGRWGRCCLIAGWRRRWNIVPHAMAGPHPIARRPHPVDPWHPRPACKLSPQPHCSSQNVYIICLPTRPSCPPPPLEGCIYLAPALFRWVEPTYL